jgi:hypothetical protein
LRYYPSILVEGKSTVENIEIATDRVEVPTAPFPIASQKHYGLSQLKTILGRNRLEKLITA